MVKDDKSFLKLLCSGNERAFAFLYREFRDKIYNFMYRNTGNREDARELTQDVFLAVHRHVKKFRGDSSLSTWIFRIATNRMINFGKRKQSKLRRNVNIDKLEFRLSSQDRKPDEAAEKTELEVAVQEELVKMDEDLRTILVLRDLQGFAYNEIEHILGIPLGTVKSRLHTARRTLKQMLEQRWKRTRT